MEKKKTKIDTIKAIVSVYISYDTDKKAVGVKNYIGVGLTKEEVAEFEAITNTIIKKIENFNDSLNY